MGAEYVDRDEFRKALIDALDQAAVGEPPGSAAALYITFNTGANGVRIARWLRDRHPQQLTIVLQHQFWNLEVTDSGFEVRVSFKGKVERVRVPFTAVQAFRTDAQAFARMNEIAKNVERVAVSTEQPNFPVGVICLDEHRERKRNRML